MKGWLGKERATEILDQDSFVCHKTVNYADPEQDNSRRQCAGHMSICKGSNMFNRMAGVYGIEISILNEEQIFSSKEEAIEHHSTNTNNR